MFEKFSAQVTKSIMIAMEESFHSKKNFIGTEHILIGLYIEDKGLAGKLLRKTVDLKYLKSKIKEIADSGLGSIAEEPPFTTRSRKVLDMSWQEALRCGYDYIETENLLMALLKEGNGIAVTSLKEIGIDINNLCKELIKFQQSSISKTYLNRNIEFISWSYDSKTIAFIIESKIFIYNVELNKIELIYETYNNGIKNIYWSPNGEWLCYNNGRLWLLKRDGSIHKEIDPGDLYSDENTSYLIKTLK